MDTIRHFALSFIEHYFLIILLSIIAVFLFFAWKHYIVTANSYLHNIPKRIWHKFRVDDVKKIAAAVLLHEEQVMKIKEDINKNILLLRSCSTQEKETAVQQLLQYPSAKGSLEIVKLAIKMNKKSSRENLICELCTSIKKLDWYN